MDTRLGPDGRSPAQGPALDLEPAGHREGPHAERGVAPAGHPQRQRRARRLPGAAQGQPAGTSESSSSRDCGGQGTEKAGRVAWGHLPSPGARSAGPQEAMFLRLARGRLAQETGALPRGRARSGGDRKGRPPRVGRSLQRRH